MIRSVGIQQWECKLCVLCSLSPTYLLTYLSLQRPNGVTFLASPGSTEFTKRWNPQSGDIVSYKHHGFLLGTKKPKFPTLYRVRDDLQWHDVVQNWKEVKYQKPSGTTLATLLQYYNDGFNFSLSSSSAAMFARGKVKPKGYWHKVENRRQLLLRFAEDMQFDPLQPTSWNRAGLLQKLLTNKVLSHETDR